MVWLKFELFCVLMRTFPANIPLFSQYILYFHIPAKHFGICFYNQPVFKSMITHDIGTFSKQNAMHNFLQTKYLNDTEDLAKDYVIYFTPRHLATFYSHFSDKR